MWVKNPLWRSPLGKWERRLNDNIKMDLGEMWS
jgi:hypothetical protein